MVEPFRYQLALPAPRQLDGAAVEFEAYIRALVAGVPAEASVQDDPQSDAAQARTLAQVLTQYGRFVRNKTRPTDCKPGDWYIGRPTLWGNSFRLARDASDDERRLAVLQYARQFAARSSAQRHMMLAKIREKLGQGSRLVCWCAPKLCHGQVLAYWALTGRDPLLPAPDTGGERARRKS